MIHSLAYVGKENKEDMEICKSVYSQIKVGNAKKRTVKACRRYKSEDHSGKHVVWVQSQAKMKVTFLAKYQNFLGKIST